MKCKHAVEVEDHYVCPECIENFKRGLASEPLRLDELEEEEENKSVHLGNTDFGFNNVQM